MTDAVSKRSTYWEPTLVFLAVLLLLELGSSWPLIGQTGLLIPILFVWLPCILLLLNRTSHEKLGIVTGTALREQLLCLLSLLPILALYSLFHLYVLDRFLHFGTPARKIIFSPMGLLLAFAFECAYVALPEEFFFRGYLQGATATDENDWWPVLYGALLFAVTHIVVSVNPRRFEVFFPGLLFGWYRTKTKAIWISVLAHGACNVTFYCLMQKAWLT